MIYRRFLTIAPVCAVLLAGQAQGSDDAVLGAYAAFRAGDPDKLARYASTLQGHALEPWADYWRLRLRIERLTRRDQSLALGLAPSFQLCGLHFTCYA